MEHCRLDHELMREAVHVMAELQMWGQPPGQPISMAPIVKQSVKITAVFVPCPPIKLALITVSLALFHTETFHAIFNNKTIIIAPTCRARKQNRKSLTERYQCLFYSFNQSRFVAIKTVNGYSNKSS